VSAQHVPVTERTLVWRSYDAFNRRDPEAALPLYTPGCRWSMRHFTGWPDDQEYHGHEGLKRLFADLLSAWGEFRIVPTALWHLGGGRWFIDAHMSATGVSSGVPLEASFTHLGTMVGGRIDTVDQYAERDEALADAGVSAEHLAAAPG
jgi:ketosteroid isomerase-like protein